MSRFDIRPHHGLCTAFFEGRGYSPLFIQHMTEVLHLLQENNLEIRLVIRKDQICQACPHCQDQHCESECKVREYDSKVLAFCNLKENDSLLWKDFCYLVTEHILKQDLLSQICQNCQWFSICKKKCCLYRQHF